VLFRTRADQRMACNDIHLAACTAVDYSSFRITATVIAAVKDLRPAVSAIESVEA
jgi:hypothetical protein